MKHFKLKDLVSVRKQWMTFVVALMILPVISWANDAEQIVKQIEAIQGLTAFVDPDIPDVVNVSGSAEGVTSTLSLNIDADVTVKWGAIYSGTAKPLISLSGNGVFEVVGGMIRRTDAGNAISATDVNSSIGIVVSGGGVYTTQVGSAIYVSGNDASVVVSGGDIHANTLPQASTTASYAIDATGSNASVVVSDGNVSVNVPSNRTGNAIHTTGQEASVVVSGGNVYATNAGNAIHTIGKETSIEVSGGKVYTTNSGSAIYAEGEDASVVVSGGMIEANTGTAIRMSGAKATVTVSGNAEVYTHATTNVQLAIYMANKGNTGMNVIVKDNGIVAALNTTGNGYAIQTYGDVEITDNAEIYAVGEVYGRAINALGRTSTVRVYSGKLWTKNGIVIHTDSIDANVIVSGGELYSESTSNLRAVIHMSCGGNVTVNGSGKVHALGDGGVAIATDVAGTNSSLITIAGDALITATTGNAIRKMKDGNNITIHVNGGMISSTTGNAVHTTSYGTIHVSGGMISSTTGNAIHTTSDGVIHVNGGSVTATTGLAIYPGTNGKVNINGGFVFAYGAAISGNNTNNYYVIRMSIGSTLTIDESGVVVAWNYDNWDKKGKLPYASGSSADLGFLPANDVTAVWSRVGADNGIAYKNGTNEGFFQLPVQVVLETDFGLIFDVLTASFYVDKAGNGDPADAEIYTAQADQWSWDSSTNTLALDGFVWETLAPVALTITGGNLTVDLKGANTFTSSNGQTVDSYGIYTTHDLILSGNGVLNATAGSTTAAYSSGLKAKSITTDRATVRATGSDSNSYSFGIETTQLQINSGMVEATGKTGAFDAAPTLPSACVYMVSKSTVPPPSGTLFYPGSSETAYTYDANDLYVKIASENVAAVSDAIIDGETDTALSGTQTASISLYGEITSAELSEFNAASWFNNLPSGITVTADATLAGQTISLTFSGTPTETSSAVFNIIIPANALTSGAEMAVQPNILAKFAIVEKENGNGGDDGNGSDDGNGGDDGNGDDDGNSGDNGNGGDDGNRGDNGQGGDDTGGDNRNGCNIVNGGDDGQDDGEGKSPPPTFPVVVVNGTGSGSYKADDLITATAATAPERQQFVRWEITPLVSFVNGTSPTSSVVQFSMPDQDVRLTAIYEYIPSISYGIAVLNDGNGTAFASAASAKQGSVITLTANANDGYRFKRWQVQKGHVMLSSETDNPAQFRMRDYGVEVKAIFEADTDENDDSLGIHTGNDVIGQVDMLKACFRNGVLHISGVKAGTTIRVYNMAGMLIYQGVSSGNDVEMLHASSLPGRGVYIVTDGRTVVKVSN